MFVISFSLRFGAPKVVLGKIGDTLIVNGDPLNFSSLPDGAELPAEAMENDAVEGNVSRTGDEIRLTVVLPYEVLGHVDAPEPLMITEDGPITLPEIAVPIDVAPPEPENASEAEHAD
jgi:hypothetical protein